MAAKVYDNLKATRPFTWKGRDFASGEPFDDPLTTREFTRLRDAGRVRMEEVKQTKAKAKPRTKRSKAPVDTEQQREVADPLD